MKRIDLKISLIVLFFGGLVLFGPVLKAQDQILLTNGNELNVKIVEVLEKTVSYKIYDKPEGPLYIINKTEIATIIYENGQTEIYNNLVKKTESEKPEIPAGTQKFRKNIFLMHVLDFTWLDYTISYERISNDGKFGFQVPVCIGLSQNGDGPDFGPFHNVFYSGLGLKYYPLGQKTVSYFFGPSVKIGMGEEMNWGFMNEQLDKAYFVKIHFNNGIMISPAGGFTFSAIGGIGVRGFDIYENKSGSNYDGIRGITPSGYVSIMLGYRL